MHSPIHSGLCVFALAVFVAAPPLTKAQTQGIIQGQVTEEESGATLPGAHIFLANTLIGDISDENGQFVIEEIPAGSYQLLATMIGFKSFQRAVELQPGETTTLVVRLQRDIYAVGEITIEESRPKGWKRDLNQFERIFLGNTPNRRGCEISNPYVIDFERQGSFFEASASAPVIVENRSLGYRITYLLTHFQSDQREYRYQGEPFFELMKPSSEREANRWRKRRADTYEGSFRHFLRTLAAGTAIEDGFRLYIMDQLIWGQPDRTFLDNARELDAEVTPDSILISGDQPHERSLHFDGYLHVRYLNQTMLPNFYDDVKLGYNASKEVIRSAVDVIYERAVFNEMGFLNNAYHVGRYGYWSWESGVCNLLPFEYEWRAANTE